MVRADPTQGTWERYGWLMAAVWMVFLFFPANALVASSAPLVLLALGWVGLACFAASYLVGFIVGMRAGWAQPSRAAVWLYAVALLCAAATVPAIGWEATSFLPFLMSFASYNFARVWHWVATGAALAIIVLEVAVDLAAHETPPWTLLAIVAMMAAVNTVTTWLLDRSQAEDELRMELATSEEREAVARDVHDLLGHSLTIVKLKTELAMRLIERDPAAARAELEEIARLTGEAIAGVRATVTGLRSSGMAEQLRASREVLESGGIAVEIAGDAGSLSPAQSIPAAWVLREATTNILRHSGAGRVRIAVEPGTVVVEDDGAGVGLGAASRGHGLRGMAERASAAGAVLCVEPVRGGAHSGAGGEGSAEAEGEGPPAAEHEGSPTGGARGTRVSLTW